MSDALKALCRETKALIIVSEFEAKRMPMFQLRSVLESVVRDDEERKVVVDLVEADLRATGYPSDQVAAFLNDLLATPQSKPILPPDQGLLGTRRLRSPFAMGFEQAEGATTVASAPERQTRVIARPSAAANAGFLSPTPPPPDTPAPQLPPMPPPVITGPAPIPLPSRRSTMIFEGAKNSAPSTEGQVPVGERMLQKHEILFGGGGGKEIKPLGASKPIVLIADDDKRARMVYKLRIEAAGFMTIECEDGAQAWERIQQGGINAVVLDMKMPGMHGLEVLSNMAAMADQVPVVVCSAYDQLNDEFVVKSYSKLKYLTKPVAPDRLVAALRELTGQPTQ